MSNIIKLFLIPAILLLLTVSCISSGKTSSSDTVQINNQDNQVYQKPGIELYIDFFDMACNTPVREGKLFFYGFSPRYTLSALEEKNAFESGKESALIFNNVRLSFASIGINRKLLILTDPKAEQVFNESLSLSDSRRTNLGYFTVYEIDKKLMPGQTDYFFPQISNSSPLTRPEWLTRLPEAEGYLFSAGASGRYSSITESIKKADLNALEEMMKQKITGIITTGIEYSAAEISGFYIIKRWWAPEMDYFYSLAAAPK